MAHKDIACFYRHSDVKKDIGLQHADDKTTIGPNLQHVFDFLRHENLAESAYMYVKEGDPGHLYVAHRKLFTFRHPRSENLAQVYEVVLCSQGHWSQDVSALFKGEYRDDIAKHFQHLGYSPKHSHLEHECELASSLNVNGLWLDDIVDFEQMMPK